MAPEYGATCGFFPIDSITLEYLRGTGRESQHIALVEEYAKLQGIYRTDSTPDPIYTSTVELNMGDVVPSVAGPRRPQDRIILDAVKDGFHATFGDDDSAAEIDLEGQKAVIGNGAVALAAITSCTNTSNPSVMVGAGLLAKNAVERGMASKPWVKTSMAPGSQVVTDYLDSAGLTSYLEQLGFHTVGYGCTTCIGNSGSLPDAVSSAIAENDFSVAAVVSGNRNFESRIHAEIKANYLASPILVVAYALAGTMNIDLTKDSLGEDKNGNPIYLKDIWPSQTEIRETVEQSLRGPLRMGSNLQLYPRCPVLQRLKRTSKGVGRHNRCPGSRYAWRLSYHRSHFPRGCYTSQ